MSIPVIRDVLFVCFMINFGLLLWWFCMFIFAHDLIYKMHSRWFKISAEKFDAIHYAGIACYKIGIFFFNVVPFFALQVVGD